MYESVSGANEWIVAIAEWRKGMGAVRSEVGGDGAGAVLDLQVDPRASGVEVSKRSMSTSSSSGLALSPRGRGAGTRRGRLTSGIQPITKYLTHESVTWLFRLLLMFLFPDRKSVV